MYGRIFVQRHLDIFRHHEIAPDQLLGGIVEMFAGNLPPGVEENERLLHA